MMSDKYWDDVANFLNDLKLPISAMYGPMEFEEVGLKLMPISAISALTYPDVIIIHKGVLEELDIEMIGTVLQRMHPAFANEVFVVYLKEVQAEGVIDSVHYQAFVEKFRVLKNKLKSIVEAPAPAPARMAVYLGNNRALTKTIYGQKMLVDTRDISLAPHILLDGYWEKWITNVFLESVRPGMNVVDVGANIGFYSLLAAKNIGNDGQLTCFEANPELAEIVFDNIAINGYMSNTTVVSKAAFSESTTLEFNIYNKFMGSSSLWADEAATALFQDEIRTIKVEAISLDEYFPKGHKIDFIKIDAEGAEPYILKGARRILNENKSIQVLMEFSTVMIQAAYGSVEDYYQEIKSYGFEIYRINPDSTLQALSQDEAVKTAHCDVLLKK